MDQATSSVRHSAEGTPPGVCVACGTGNAGDRLLCRGCGADLDGRPTSAPLPVGDAGTSAGGGRGVAARRPTRWVSFLVLAALAAIVGLTALVLAWAEVGPFAEGEPVLEPVEFPAASYPGEPAPVTLSDVATLTVRPSTGERSFGPAGLVDGEAGSAWHGDPSQLPEGGEETVDLLLDQPAWVSAVVLANGDHASAAAYADAGWVEEVALSVDGGQTWSARLIDLGRDLQVVELPEPVLTRAVRLTIRGVRPGVVHPGPAISDVAVLGHLADEQDAALARERAELRPADGAVEVPSRSLQS